MNVPDTMKHRIPAEMCMTKHMTCRWTSFNPMDRPYTELKTIRTDNLWKLWIE